MVAKAARLSDIGLILDSDFQEDFHEHTWKQGDGVSGVIVEFDAIEDEGSGKMFCEAAIWWVLDDPTASPLINYERVNLLNRKGTGWGGLVTRMLEFVPEIDWEYEIRTVVNHTISTFRANSSAGGMLTPKDPHEAGSPFLLRPYISSSGVTVIYGPRDSGKSQFCLGLGVVIGTGVPIFGETPEHTGKVLYVDFEDDDEPHALRLWAMAQEIGYEGREEELNNIIHHERITGALRDVKRKLRNLVRKGGFKLVIVDSVGLARAGDVSASDVTIKLFKALRFLNVPVVAIDHVKKDTLEALQRQKTRARPDQVQAIGSQFTMSSARLAWFFHPVETMDPLKIQANLYNTKHNHVAQQVEHGISIDITNIESGLAGTIKFETDASIFVSAFFENPVRVSIAQGLSEKDLTGTELSALLDASESAIRKALLREDHKDDPWFKKAPKRGRNQPYTLTETGRVAVSIFDEEKSW